MALDQLVGNSQNFIPMNPNDPSLFRRLDGPGPNIGGNNPYVSGNIGTGNLAGILQPSPPSVSPIGGGGNLATLPEGNLRPEFGISRPMPRPYRPPGFGDYIGLQPPMLGIAQPDYSSQFDKFGETLGGYSSQFDKFGEQLGGLGEQMTGYQDALGSFNEQVGGMGKQFETINNRLDSVDKGLGSLGNQIASFENMQKAQPQQVMQPQRPTFNPFGFGGFGGLGSLFGRRY